MQDLRAAPRWSKTAVIVVLVVFGLVLLVAVFGLWAFTSQRERNEAQARENAFADGRSLLEKVPREIAEKLDGVLTRARRLDPILARQPNDGASDSLKSFLGGVRHGPLTAHAWRVQADGSVWWLGGRYLVWDRRDRIEALAAAHAQAWEHQGDTQDAALRAYKEGGPRRALGHWAELATSHGLAASGDPRKPAFPDGMGYAKMLVTLAAEAAGAGTTPLPATIVRDAALRALEVEALNRIRHESADDGRPRLADDFETYARDIAEEIDRLLGHLPADVREPLAWEIDQFRSAAAYFAGGKHDRYVYVLTARDHAQEKHPQHHVAIVSEGDQIFGVEQRQGDVSYIVLFDRTGIEGTVSGVLAAHESAFRSLGLESRWLPDTVTPRIEGFEGRTHTVRLTGRVHLPYQLAIFQTGQPRANVEGFTNLLFWVVIGLAAAGLLTGGYVLVRLLTREIRLAQLKADFVSNLSHELKTPITSMLLFTEMLEDGKLTNAEDQAEAFGVLGQESRRLQRIVARMIDVARGEARTTPYVLAPGDLNRPVLSAGTRFRRIVTEPGLDLDLHLAPELLPVQMDEQALDDVVTNLLSNAWKYKRGDRARVAVRTVRQGRFAEIVVSDDGIGIPRADRRRVFEMFYRSEQYLTHPVTGTGLGLALVRSVVAGHKGRIDLEPGEGGVGSVFRVRIPLDRKAHAALVAGGDAPVHEPTDESPMEPGSHGKVSTPPAPQDEDAASRAANPGSPS